MLGSVDMPKLTKEYHCTHSTVNMVVSAHARYVLASQPEHGEAFKNMSKVISELSVAMVHAAAKKKLMGSLLNVIRAIIDIMPGRCKTISITLQLTLASTQIQYLIHNFNFVLLYSELHYTKCIIKSCCDSLYFSN